jgi:hypothetical protein
MTHQLHASVIRACVLAWLRGKGSLSEHSDEELNSTGKQAPFIQATTSLKSYETVWGSVSKPRRKNMLPILQHIHTMNELHVSKITTLSDDTWRHTFFSVMSWPKELLMLYLLRHREKPLDKLGSEPFPCMGTVTVAISCVVHSWRIWAIPSTSLVCRKAEQNHTVQQRLQVQSCQKQKLSVVELIIIITIIIIIM